jgi:hypothetical protein
LGRQAASSLPIKVGIGGSQLSKGGQVAGLRELTERQRRDADMIQDPGSWPLGALLLQREREGTIDCAFILIHRPRGQFRLFRGNVHEVIDGESIPYEDYMTAEEIVINGWKVD